MACRLARVLRRPRPVPRRSAPRSRCASTSAAPRSAAASTGSNANPTAACGWSTTRPAAASPGPKTWRPTRSSAPTSWPSSSGAFGTEGQTSAGAALLHLGKAAGTTGKPALQQQEPPLDTQDDPAWAAAAGGRDGRRHGRRRVRGDARFVVHLLPGQDVVPRHAGGEHAAMTDPLRRSALAEALGLPPPTDEQRAVIEADPLPAGPRRGRRRLRARPRRWPRASSGWSPTATSSPTRSSASPSPARRPPSWPSGSAGGCAASPTPGSGRPSPWTRTAPSRWAASPSCRPTTRMRVGWSASTRCGSGTSRSRGCCPRRRRGSTPTRWSAATTATSRS